MQIWKKDLPKFFYWIVYAFLHNLALYTFTLSSKMGVLLTKTKTSARVQINSAALHSKYARYVGDGLYGYFPIECTCWLYYYRM